MKDGLLPLTEWLGRSPWFDRLFDILNDLHKLTAVTTKIKGEYGGGVPEIEINGNMLQIPVPRILDDRQKGIS
jgi:hypothetical protein